MLMYEFWYDYLKPKYDNNIGFCYMDTDSFIFRVETEDFIKVFLMMLKIDLIHLPILMILIDLCQLEKIKRCLV